MNARQSRNRRVVGDHAQAQFNPERRMNLHTQDCGVQQIAAQIE